MNRIALTLVGLSFILFSCGVEESHNHEAAHDHDSHAAEIATLTAELEAATAKPGLIHNVYFWLAEDLTDEARVTFMDGAKSLGTIESVQAFYMGAHADTEARDVVDHSYDLSLVVMFEDQAAQDAYQIDPIHLAFIEASADAWTSVKVYDVAIE